MPESNTLRQLKTIAVSGLDGIVPALIAVLSTFRAMP